MDSAFQMRANKGDFPHFVRPRLNRLLTEAAKRPVVIVCAGAGYGKTLAVSDFLSQQDLPVGWEQLSDRDNVVSRSWENLSHTFTQMNKQLGMDIRDFGFPDTEEKYKQFYQLYERSMPSTQQYILVLDDFHFVNENAVLSFVEYAVNYMPSNRKTMIIISREPLSLNLTNLQTKGLIAYIYEEDLNFTESELSEYMSLQGLSIETKTLREIWLDTKGWAFAVNFIVQSLKKSPNYSGYVRNAMKKNFFQLMETEVFNMVSEQLRRLLVCLSLIGHLSAELVAILAGEDKNLLSELEHESSFVRFDSYNDAYMIHHIFLDFLSTKQEILTEEEKRRTYKIAADWCNRNDFKIDALAYYERIGDYESIVPLFEDLPMQLSKDVALIAAQILSRAPADAFATVSSLAGLHVRVIMSLERWQEAFELIKRYETQLLQLPEDDKLRNRTLAGIYYTWAIMRQLLSTADDCYDFHIYFAKMAQCFTKSPSKPNKLSNYPIGPWFNLVGVARQGALQEYIDSLTNSVGNASSSFNGCMAGIDDLARGELKYYQGDVREAEFFIQQGLVKARAGKQYELVHRAYFYLMRIAVSQGLYSKALQALNDTKSLLDEDEFTSRFIANEITYGAFCIYTMQLDIFPSFLKDNFSPFGHTFFNENSTNQVKALYCYNTGNYAPLMAYIEECKQREFIILYCRAELTAMEACLLFKKKNRSGAFSTLRKGYEIASPNSLIMPFMSLGNDMRTLIGSAIRDPDIGIPKKWLEMIARKSASYAKHQSQFRSSHDKSSGGDGDISLSARELEVLRHLYNGLSRSEIAAHLNLSINSVKLIINNIYLKLDARNLADVIRITAERNLLSEEEL